ncbi:MAG: hypothetical protein IKJ27_09440 [Clostridia bacterium]|nr:hypothetical protein [Clostridia bacterium]
MKLKNSITSLRLNKLSAAFAVLLFICTVFRTLQMLFFIEPETGFNTGPSWLMVLFYILISGGCFVLSLISFLSKETAELDLDGVKSKAISVSSFVFAATLLYDWFCCIFEGVSSYAVVQVGSGFKGLMSSGFLTGTLQSFFAFFSMIYFVVLGFDMKRGTRIASQKFKIMALAPVGWASVRLVHRFISQISFLEVSDLFLELLMLSFTVMFFMAFAQVVSGVNSTGFSWRLYGFGSSAAMISVTVNISRSIVVLIKGSSALNPSYMPEIADIAFAVFIIMLIGEFVRYRKFVEEV